MKVVKMAEVCKIISNGRSAMARILTVVGRCFMNK
jgi:ribosomal protein S5